MCVSVGREVFLANRSAVSLSKAAGWTQWGAGKHFSCQLTPQYVHTSFFLFCFEIIEIELKCRQCILVALGDLLLQNVPHGEDISENISVPTRAFTNCTRDPGCMYTCIHDPGEHADMTPEDIYK